MGLARTPNHNCIQWDWEEPTRPPSKRSRAVSLSNATTTSCRTMRELLQIHAVAIKLELADDVSVASPMVSFCALSDSGNLHYARLLFRQLPRPDSFLWNTMIRGHAQSDAPADAFSLFNHMLNQGAVPPDKFTFPFALKACARLQASEEGEQLHSHVVKSGVASDPVVQNALIHMYAQCGLLQSARLAFDRDVRRRRRDDVVAWNSLIGGYLRYGFVEEAGRLFAEMPHQKTALSWNVMVAGYARSGRPELARSLLQQLPAEYDNGSTISLTSLLSLYVESGNVEAARRVFDKMTERDVVSWSAMISGYVRSGRHVDALNLFNDLRGSNIKPDDVLLVSVISACAQLGALDQGKWVHAFMQKNMPSCTQECKIACALIEMYSKCGCIDNAVRVFDEMPEKKEVVAWNSIICGLGINGQGKVAVGYFCEMLKSGVEPDRVTFVGILSACSHKGLLDEGRQFFELMTSYGIEPDIKHYGCLIDLLGRAGLVEEAQGIIQSMPMTPNVEIWGALLGACRSHGHVEMAELAAKNIIDLDPDHSAVYVLLHNVYAAAGLWVDARKTREKMKAKRIKRAPGCSSIELKGRVFEFVVGDVSHSRAREIYDMLGEMSRRLKLANYVLDTSQALLDGGEEEKEAALCHHSEKLALALGLIDTCSGETIRIVKNLRVCGDCHSAMKLVSKVYDREIVLRDRNRFHFFREGSCSCMDYW